MWAFVEFALNFKFLSKNLFSALCVEKTGEVCEVDENECKADEISPQWYKIAGIGFFYVAILLVGIYATRQGKKKRRPSMDLAEDSMVAGRNIGVVVGVFTMTARGDGQFLIGVNCRLEF